MHVAGQVRVVELVRVADALVGRELEVSCAELCVWPVPKFVKLILV